ncbi:hypothetical protein OEZ85_000071 [Tetradesmus obliquus]|uniref:Tyrosine-protein kinase ephrin type A/B receptor-like domain-containing protein n=1 Tax=Tetradesmus obliquus TaxID=3088 RepID=A0ABY8UP07_TETOB|nr:hypothetical protein OEZ85_000071 [Tetradesmus obliquus]
MRALAALLLLLGAVGALSNRAPSFGRSLQQTTYTCTLATGCTRCPDGCMAQTGSCIGDDTSGNFRCKRCQLLTTFDNPKENLRPAADGSCGCARGYYLDTSATRKCVICPKNFWCPGGTESASKVTTGSNPTGQIACPTNMVTVNTGAFNRLFCVNNQGYSYNAPTTATGDPSATVCPENTFSPGFKRQDDCTPCPSGLKTDNGLPNTIDFVPSSVTVPSGYTKQYTDTAGTTQQTSSAACKVPPGWYVTSSNKVIRCPRGEYREGYVATTATGANKCVRCPRGTTTYAAASPTKLFCDVLVPGHYWIDPATRPGVGTVAVQYTRICEQKSYCPGGYPTDNPDAGGTVFDGKVACPNELWTKENGAKSSANCLVPPGHYLPTGTTAVVTGCLSGEYSPDWRKQGDAGVDICKPCGAGLRSDTVDSISVFVLATTGADSGFVANTPSSVLNVRRSSSSCFITKGQGTVLAAGSTMADPKYKAITCPANTYGVADKTYELRLSPCKDCPTNTYTSTSASGACITGGTSYKDTTGSGGFYDPRACCTLPGWGFDGVRASVCAQGTYNTAADEPADQCKACPPGTTTNGAVPSIVGATTYATFVDDITDCEYTQPGYGQQNAAEVPGLDAGLKECPKGKYSEGGSIFGTDANGNQGLGGLCQDCPKGKTTLSDGATKASNCIVCPAGMGFPTPASSDECKTCPVNTFGDPGREGGDYACQQCPANAASFNFYIGGGATGENTITVKSVSEEGATSAQQCLLEFAAIETGNWYLPTFGALTSALTPVTATTADACRVDCSSDEFCQFFTFDYGTEAAPTPTCVKRVAPTPTKRSGIIRIAYKVLAGTNDGAKRRSLLGGAATPKEVGSGAFSWFKDDDAANIGTTMTIAGSPSTVPTFLAACNDNSACAAVVFTFTTSAATTLSTPCEFKSGAVNLPTSADYTKRTMVKYTTKTDAKPAAA